MRRVLSSFVVSLEKMLFFFLDFDFFFFLLPSSAVDPPKSRRQQHNVLLPVSASTGTYKISRSFTSCEPSFGPYKSLSLSTELKRNFPLVVPFVRLDLTRESLLEVYPRSTVVSKRTEFD